MSNTGRRNLEAITIAAVDGTTSSSPPTPTVTAPSPDLQPVAPPGDNSARLAGAAEGAASEEGAGSTPSWRWARSSARRSR